MSLGKRNLPGSALNKNFMNKEEQRKKLLREIGEKQDEHFTLLKQQKELDDKIEDSLGRINKMKVDLYLLGLDYDEKE